MNPLLDQIAVAVVVLAALGFLVRQWAGQGKKGCASGCCSVKPPLPPHTRESTGEGTSR